jgi:septal ring factor EnvC (AmiA/AmiB activator)
MGGPDLQERIVSFKPFAEKRLKSLQEERNELRRELNRVQQEAQMDQVALRAVKEQIKQLQTERLEMEEELAFLRGIVSDTSDKNGLRVQKFKLVPGLEKGQFDYQFSVSQVIGSGTTAKGKILISVEGLQKDQAVTLDLKEMTDGKIRSHKMRFRFFQNIEGTLMLPDDFVPAKIVIEVDPEGKKQDTVKAIYDWPI